MAVQHHTSNRPKKSATLGTIDFKFNNEQGYFVEANYNRAYAMKCPEIVDVLKDISDYGRKQMEDMFRKLDERENKQTAPKDVVTEQPAEVVAGN